MQLLSHLEAVRTARAILDLALVDLQALLPEVPIAEEDWLINSIVNLQDKIDFLNYRAEILERS